MKTEIVIFDFIEEPTTIIYLKVPSAWFSAYLARTQRVAYSALERRLYPARTVSHFCLKIVTFVPVYAPFMSLMCLFAYLLCKSHFLRQNCYSCAYYFVFLWNNYTFWIRFCLISYYYIRVTVLTQKVRFT